MTKAILKILTISGVFIAIFSLILPVNAQCYNNNYPQTPSQGSYTYRLTVLGTNVRETSKNVFEIVNAKSNFTSAESVVAFTRLFNLNKINSFAIKHQLITNGGELYRELISTNYWPYGKWWAETYIWNKFDNVPAGSYQVKVFISIDGRDWKYLDAKSLTVSSNITGSCVYANYYNNCNTNYNNNNNNNNYNNNNIYLNNYNYNWTKTGGNVTNINQTDYDIVNQKVDFRINETVYALTKISNLRGVNNFKIKQDLFLNGIRFFSSQESPAQQPQGNVWNNYYYWGKFNNLPSGYHEIRMYISINNGRYILMDTKQISVGKATANNYTFRYNYSDTDRYVAHVSGYIYNMNNPTSNFTTSEPVMVLTKLSAISGINNFRIKHELYDGNNNLIRQLESPMRLPHYNFWEYNYSWSDFGTLAGGNYVIKVYISLNDNPYNYLDTKYITVRDSYNTVTSYNYFANPNYHYDGTQTGTTNYQLNNSYYRQRNSNVY